MTENTIVVYASDNGYFLGDHGMYNKMWMYEESLRIPLLVRFPNEIKAKTQSNELVSVLDFAATFADYAGAEKPVEFQGKSLRPLLTGKTPDDWRDTHFYHYYDQFHVPSHYGIRTKDYKLIHFYAVEKGPKWEFYDLNKDPKELNNVINETEYSDTVKKLEVVLMKKRMECDGTTEKL